MSKHEWNRPLWGKRWRTSWKSNVEVQTTDYRETFPDEVCYFISVWTAWGLWLCHVAHGVPPGQDASSEFLLKAQRRIYSWTMMRNLVTSSFKAGSKDVQVEAQGLWGLGLIGTDWDIVWNEEMTFKHPKSSIGWLQTWNWMDLSISNSCRDKMSVFRSKPINQTFPRGKGSKLGISLQTTTIFGWWFGTFFILPYIENNHPNWLIFFRGVAQPPARWLFVVYNWWPPTQMA